MGLKPQNNKLMKLETLRDRTTSFRKLVICVCVCSKDNWGQQLVIYHII